ncbi:MAG: hypothetical protein K6E29_08795 [Cyanobacteria bacterium RUI128]|nr:hypothetical protein [Cyanobacteria bacterium RUI128]
MFLFAGVCYANVLPADSDEIPVNSIGVYQIDKRVTIYTKPDETSGIIADREIVYQNYVGLKSDNMFAVVLPQKEISYLYVIDISEDECWMKVIYDKAANKSGWVYKSDDFQFMPWMNFFNLYGKKYGLSELKCITHNENVYSQPDEDSQILGQVNRPKFIRLTAVEGNWVLVSILDFTSETTTGYVQWRNQNGKLYMFPAIK